MGWMPGATTVSGDFNRTDRNTLGSAMLCRTASLGIWRIRARSSTPGASRGAINGSRPMISWISPNAFRSSGITCRSNPSAVTRRFSANWNPNPSRPSRLAIISSRPTNESALMTRTLGVSKGTPGCIGCLSPPCGGIG